MNLDSLRSVATPLYDTVFELSQSHWLSPTERMNLRSKWWVIVVLAIVALSPLLCLYRHCNVYMPQFHVDPRRSGIKDKTKDLADSMSERTNGTTRDPRAKTFPVFNDSGVILFYHLAKTGGVTVCQNLKKLKNVDYVRTWNKADFDDIVKDIDAILTGNATKILFVEMHSGDVLPGLVELHPLMQQWRQLFQENGVPFFGFTLLRDPIYIHVSAFLFFHLRRCSAQWCSKKRFAPTEENLLLSVTPNRQCLSLARGQDHVDRQNVTAIVSAAECQEVEDLLRQDWDWIGTTEELNNTTLPFLFTMLNRRKFIGKVSSSNIKTFPPGDPANVVEASNLTSKTKRALEDLSRLDLKLYDAFRGGFIAVEHSN